MLPEKQTRRTISAGRLIGRKPSDSRKDGLEQWLGLSGQRSSARGKRSRAALTDATPVGRNRRPVLPGRKTFRVTPR